VGVQLCSRPRRRSQTKLAQDETSYLYFECFRNFRQRRLLGVAYRHSANAEKSSFLTVRLVCLRCGTRLRRTVTKNGTHDTSKDTHEVHSLLFVNFGSVFFLLQLHVLVLLTPRITNDLCGNQAAPDEEND
jgi:hypothetical protein